MTRKAFAVIVVLVGTAIFVAGWPGTPVTRGGAPPDLHGQETVDFQPERPPSSVPLASGVLRSAVQAFQRGLPTSSDVQVVDGRVRVEVLHTLPSSDMGALIAGYGGTVEGEIEGLTQALVPFDRLVALENHEGVQFVRPPSEANVPPADPVEAPGSPQNGVIVGEEVAKTNADDWHVGGQTGAGVKVGIVDFFDDTLWDSAAAAGEVPSPAGTFCRCGGSSCDMWSAGEPHGQAVAEVIHEMAPSAQLYLATVCSTTDLQAAVDYFDAQGVDLVSRSLTARYDGPGDGTGPIATVIDNAVGDGMAWFNSAGNSASDGSFDGQYWRGQWSDADGDRWLDFASGDELLRFHCPFSNGLRWSDFGASDPTDYDVYIFDNPDDPDPIAASVDDQTTGAPPLELDILCRGSGEVDYLGIHLFDPGNGTSGDVLEFMTNRGGLEYWQNPHSASGPASDTASPGGLSVGAIDPPLGTGIAPYSSQGPTNDGLYGGTDRIKPDISAAAGVSSFTYEIFSGTSASAPTAAGAAALVLGAGLAGTPAEVKTYLLGQATVDRGGAGPDNVFGAGELALPPLAADPDGDGVPNSMDNCPSVFNPGQENADAAIDNGPGIPGDDGTVPNAVADAEGDACETDGDADNDGLPDSEDTNPLGSTGVCAAYAGASDGHPKAAGGDVTNDDDRDGDPAVATGADAGDNGPSWDTDNDGVMDGYECAQGSNPRDRTSKPAGLPDDNGDADGDGLLNGWERRGWGTNPAAVDSDGDGRGDCKEVADVNGDGLVSFVADAIPHAKAALLTPASFGKTMDFDINKDGIVSFVADTIQEAKFALLTGLCK